MKKFIIVLLVTAIFYISMVNAQTFFDLSEEHWAYSAVNTMVEKEIINGYPDGNFLPERLITKAEFAKIIVETLDLKNMYEQIEYDDVSENFWAYEYINVADQFFEPIPYEPGDMFYPNQNLTREEVATIIVNAMWLDNLEYNLETLEKFSDNNEISEELKKYVAIACEKKLMRGNANGTFNPKGYLTRAEVCQLMKNIIEIKEEEQVLYSSLAGRWLPEKAYDKNNKKVSLEKIFGFEITNNNKLILNENATFRDNLYETIGADIGDYTIAGNEIVLIYNTYDEMVRIGIKEENGIRYLVREIDVWNEKNKKIEKYKIYYRFQDKTEVITDAVRYCVPEKKQIVDNTTVTVKVVYYNPIKVGKLKITNSKNEVIENNLEINYGTISSTINCEPDETYTVTAYGVFDENDYKFEDYTYKFSVSDELLNLGPQYRKYSSKKVTTKYKLEDYPEYEEKIIELARKETNGVICYNLYDINNDKKPELLVGKEEKIENIYWLYENGVRGLNIQPCLFYEICENGMILCYTKDSYDGNNISRTYLYMEIDGKNHKLVHGAMSKVYDGEITWKEEKEFGIGTAKRISKEQFYSILDEYKIIKIKLEDYNIN